MDSNELIKLILEKALDEKRETKKSGITYPIGHYVIIRSRNEGVNAGYLQEADETGCVLKEARRLWRPISKDRKLSWYEGVAASGLGEKSVVSGAVARKYIIEDYSITVCSEEATDSIRGFKANETTY